MQIAYAAKMADVTKTPLKNTGTFEEHGHLSPSALLFCLGGGVPGQLDLQVTPSLRKSRERQNGLLPVGSISAVENYLIHLIEMKDGLASKNCHTPNEV